MPSPSPAQLVRSSTSAFVDFRSAPCTEPALQSDERNKKGSSATRSIISALTVSVLQTYKRCSPRFTYSKDMVPRRVLTKPSEATENHGFDNQNSDLIVFVHDVFVSTTGSRYLVKDVLGQGTFGQVFRCVEQDSGAVVAVKVIKNQAAYYHQARVEVGVLQYLNTRADPEDKHHIVRMKDFFIFRNHLCLTFELLNLNLYELIRHNKFRGLSLPLVRVFTTQILDALAILRKSRIVHCDLKPENVLLKNIETGEVKVIDFGSACFENRTVYSYIQSRFYRSPEVVVGYPYTMSIDMWSLGCMAAELFLGLPLFPGASEHDLLCRILATLGPLPEILLVNGENTNKYFRIDREDLVADVQTGETMMRRCYALRTREEFEAATGQAAPSGKNYFQQTTLHDIITAYPFRSGISEDAAAREMLQREAFVDFLLGVLDTNPDTRWTPRQAIAHPFITGEAYIGPFKPPADPSTARSVQWARSSPSPTPVGTPMSIPIGRSQRSQGCGVGSSPWLSSGGGSATAAAPAMAATPPEVHAQAHAAAVAAVQAQMSMRQQHHAATGGLGSSYGVLQNGFLLPHTPTAHGLQSILPSLAAAMAASYGVASLGGTPMANSLNTPLLTPPSRSFGPHLRFGDYVTARPGLDGLGAAGFTPTAANVQTPALSGGLAFSPMQLGSFTPSSVTTYQAALAAAHGAVIHHQQQRQIERSGQQQPQLDSSGFPHQPVWGQKAFAAPGQQLQMQPTSSSLGVSQRQGERPSAIRMQEGLEARCGPAPSTLVVEGEQLGPAWQRHDSAEGSQAASGGGAEGGIPVRQWMSQDGGGSMGGTPSRQEADGLAGVEESGPNPADWDPLWSDELLEEDGGGQACGKRSGTAVVGRVTQEPQQAPAAPLYPNSAENVDGQLQNIKPSDRRGTNGSHADEVELPASYCLPLPTDLLLGHQISRHQQQQQQQQQQNSQQALVQPPAFLGAQGGNLPAAQPAPNPPLPSSTLLASALQHGRHSGSLTQVAGSSMQQRPHDRCMDERQAQLATSLVPCCEEHQGQLSADAGSSFPERPEQHGCHPHMQQQERSILANGSTHCQTRTRAASFEFPQAPPCVLQGDGQPPSLLFPVEQQQQLEGPPEEQLQRHRLLAACDARVTAARSYPVQPVLGPAAASHLSVNAALNQSDSTATLHTLQQALNTQLTARLNQHLALASDMGGSAVGSNCDEGGPLQQGQQRSIQHSLQHAPTPGQNVMQHEWAVRHNQPMHRMQGFDILK